MPSNVYPNWGFPFSQFALIGAPASIFPVFFLPCSPQSVWENRGAKNKSTSSGTENGNWLDLAYSFLILREWKEDINAEHPDFKELDIWVQAWNFPINWIMFGNVSVPQAGNLAGKCLRLHVSVDLEQPLLRCSYAITAEFWAILIKTVNKGQMTSQKAESLKAFMEKWLKAFEIIVSHSHT
ncbi:aminotransferase [Striga asiatica]|uniref:Aminotransferase n=1 Tax=Striga asiatica TaxID=4170 RepID=A0A5A7R0E4_STRAF|nr:aminotransferase [Striga asiatica]